MRIKKYLKEKACAQRQEILEKSDKTVFDDMFEQNGNTVKIKSNIHTRLIIISASATALILAAVLICIFVFNPARVNDIVYYEKNFISETSTVEDMNENFKEFSFDIDTSLYDVNIKKTIDKLSGDTILYSVHAENKVDSITENSYPVIAFDFVAVCNPYYTYKDFAELQNYTVAELQNYKVIYNFNFEQDPDFGIYNYKARAKIEKGSEFIYIINYSEFRTVEGSLFLQTIEEVIK